MADLAFDTHRYIKRLTDVGMPEKQAEVIAYEQRALIDDQLATKQDIAALEAATRQDIAEVKRDIKESEQRLVIRLGGMMIAGFGMMIAGFGVIAALIKLLPTSPL